MLQQELVKQNIGWVTNYYPYVNPVPVNSTAFEKMLIKHIKLGSVISIFPDSDIDGMFSALEMYSLCEIMGCKNLKMLTIKNKMHGLTPRVIDQATEYGTKLLITVDSSTNNKREIERVNTFGMDHIIIDHHMISEVLADYPNNTVVINSQMIGNEKINCVSAGMLCYILIHNLLNKVKMDNAQRESFLGKMYVLGYTTLYTDCMNLANEYNLSVVQNIELRKRFTPMCIRQFMSKYDDLNRNFIEYKFAPRINMLIRREQFETVYKLLFTRLTEDERASILEFTEFIYKDGKEAVDYIVQSLPVYETPDFVISNLDDVNIPDSVRETVKNFTGLIASKHTELFHKLACVVCTDKVETYKGSVRDPYSRKALTIFESFVECGGHMSAFGIHMKKKDWDMFLRNAVILSPVLRDAKISSEIILDGEQFDDRLSYQLRSIAEYNEVSGNTLPKAIIMKKVGHNIKVKREDTYSKMKWEGVDIVAFTKVYLGDTLYITPTLTKDSVTCYATVVA